MGDIITIGLDLAKNVFQVHGVDEAGSVMLRKRLRRGQVLAFFAGIPPCLIGLEACATAHHWARELIALGHEARLMPPNYVKAYVKRNKHDVADAEAICEAVKRPSMRFVPLKTAEQQSVLMMHRARLRRVTLSGCIRGADGNVQPAPPRLPDGAEGDCAAIAGAAYGRVGNRVREARRLRWLSISAYTHVMVGRRLRRPTYGEFTSRILEGLVA